MEDQINEINSNLFTPRCAYNSIFDYPNDFSKDNFLKFSEFVNESEILIISNNDIVRLTRMNNDHISDVFQFKESNHIYDYDILYDTNSNFEGDYLKIFFVCSKDNPVRLLNKSGECYHTYLLKNHLEEVINPISVSLDQFGLTLFCGGNNLCSKIDIVSDTLMKIPLKEKCIVSSFDFNYHNSFYAMGTYSQSIYLVDYRTDSLISKVCLDAGVNQIQFLHTKTCMFLSGTRKDNKISLWDCRNLSSPVQIFFRNSLTSQKLNFTIDEADKYLICGNSDGTCIVYSLCDFHPISYFYTNCEYETVSSVDYNSITKLMITSLGSRHFNSVSPIQTDSEDEILSPQGDDKKKFHSGLLIWDMNII